MLSKEAYPEVGMEVDQATLPNLDNSAVLGGGWLLNNNKLPFYESENAIEIVHTLFYDIINAKCQHYLNFFL